MHRQIRPLIVLFIVVICLCLVKGISLLNHLHDNGVRAFCMMTPYNYVEWIVLLSFIHLYIHKNWYAWHIAFIAILTLALAFLPSVLFGKTPTDDPRLSEWYYRTFAFGYLVLPILYMLLRYKAYKAYINRNGKIEPDKLTDNKGGISYLDISFQNPLKEAFVVAVLILVFNGFSLFSRFNEKGILGALLNMSPRTGWFWLLNLTFIYLFIRNRYFAWYIAMLGAISILIFTFIERSDEDSVVPEWQLKLLLSTLSLGTVAYLLIRRKRYKSYVSK